MSNQYGTDWTDCHGGMQQLKENPNPWLNESRRDTYHNDQAYQQDQALYRLSNNLYK